MSEETHQSPEQKFFGVDPVEKRKSVTSKDMFTDTGKEMKISLAKVMNPDFETGDETAKCCECGNQAEFVTYNQEQSRFESARIVKNGAWEVLNSRVKVDGELENVTYYCERCFNAPE